MSKAYIYIYIYNVEGKGREGIETNILTRLSVFGAIPLSLFANELVDENGLKPTTAAVVGPVVVFLRIFVAVSHTRPTTTAGLDGAEIGFLNTFARNVSGRMLAFFFCGLS